MALNFINIAVVASLGLIAAGSEPTTSAMPEPVNATCMLQKHMAHASPITLSESETGAASSELVGRNLDSDLAKRMMDWKSSLIQRASIMDCSVRAMLPLHGNEGDTSCLQFLKGRTVNAGDAHVTSVPTYYISLGGNRSDMWLSKYGRSFSSDLHVVEGVRGKEQKEVEAVILEPYSIFSDIKHGVLGCTLSHLRAIKQAYDSGAEHALILEDDASPDLSPWWSQSLESYIGSLPADWQLSQLEWTSEENMASEKYAKLDLNSSGKGQSMMEANSSSLFSKGTSWGTVAYVIHRRGMERIVAQLWNSTAGKFTVGSMKKGCSYFTADDCLVSCSPYPSNSAWLHHGTEKLLEHTYKASPPMFTSYQDSQSIQTEKKPWIVSSFCDDIHSTLLYSSKVCNVL